MTISPSLNSNTRTGIRSGTHRVEFDDNAVVFLIGMRINSFWRLRDWLPTAMAMPKMLAELRKNPKFGMLSAASWVKWREVFVVQYWKDLDHLMTYATAREHEHLPAWKAFNRRARKSSSVGIWHEAYEVHPERSHIVYREMPPSGMGAAARLMDIDALPPQPVRRSGTEANDPDIAASA